MDQWTFVSGLNAAGCGHFNVPIILISGARTVCAKAHDFFGNLEMAVVKKAVGRMAAERALKRLASKQVQPPFKVESPITMVLEFVQSEMAV